jgi:hypothetical protein
MPGAQLFLHGEQVFFVLFLILFLLNIPTFVFGFLATKCALYLAPSLKRHYFVRWILPAVVALVLMVVGIGVTVAYGSPDEWPTSPVLSRWGCLAVICLLDAGLLCLWGWLKYREYKRKLTGMAVELVKEMLRPEERRGDVIDV